MKSKFNIILSLLILISILIIEGCSHVYSPPASILSLESARTLKKGKSSIKINGNVNEAVLGAKMVGGSVKIKHGATDRLEVSTEGSVVHVSENFVANIDRNIYSLRFGTKYELAKHLSILGGVGGGFYEGGYFLSPDVGLILAFENRYFVPFASIKGFYSLPVKPRTVDISVDDESLGTTIDKPDLSVGVNMSAGFRLPLSHKNHKSTSSLYIGTSATSLVQCNDQELIFSLGAGFESVF